MAPASRMVHLVGSVPLANAEQVITDCCTQLADKLARVPDGETGDRTNWINWQREIFGAHPGICLVGDGNTIGTTVPRFAIEPDFDTEITFGELGYFAAAMESYSVFTRLRDEGIVGRQRFQVSLPTPLAAIACYVDPDSQERLHSPYRDGLLAETHQILDAIPHEDLAVQWDVAIEFAVLEGLFPVWFDNPFDTVADQLAELADMMPTAIGAGFHFCYGDSGNKHFKEPDDMGLLVKLANQVCDQAERSIDWIHMPVPIDRTDAEYFRPLASLDQQNLGELFLGLLHEQDGVEGANRRIVSAQEFIDDFGLATECGLGRRSPEVVHELLELHASI